MKAPEQLFFQSVKVVGGREVPIYNLVSGSYKEAIELNGPQLQLTLNDSDSSLADDYGLIEGAVCDVRMGDAGSSARAAYFASRFTIISAVPQGDHLLICAIEKGVYDIKQPVPRPKIYGDMTPAQILADLFPGYKVDAPQTASTQKVTYHVPAGSIPSLMLRQMAKELGCAIWLARGVVHCVPYKGLLQRQPSDGAIKLEYQGNTKKSVYPIYAYRPIYQNNKAARDEKRQYMTWDTVYGLQISSVNEGCPRVFLPVANFDALDASPWRFTDWMVADLCGCGLFSAGLSASVRINRMSNDSVIDESIPLTQVFSVISHIQTPNSYKCAATMGIPQC